VLIAGFDLGDRDQALVWAVLGAELAIELALKAAFAGSARALEPGQLGGLALGAFPSGHAARSTLLAVLIIGLGRGAWRWAALAMPALIGAAAVALGAHYPSDVIGGAALGVALGLGAFELACRQARRRMVQRRP
jgi:undecaprenyl-diphosphatase